MNNENKHLNSSQSTSPTAEVEGESFGQYIEGDYGRAGTIPGRHAGEEDGQYIEADYGLAGIEPGHHDPAGMRPGEGRGYVTSYDSNSPAVQEEADEPHAGNYTDVDLPHHQRGPSQKNHPQR